MKNERIKLNDQNNIDLNSRVKFTDEIMISPKKEADDEQQSRNGESLNGKLQICLAIRFMKFFFIKNLTNFSKDVDKYENESEKVKETELRQELEKMRNDLLFYQDENDRLKNSINTLKGRHLWILFAC